MIDINLLPSQEVVFRKEVAFREKFFLAIWICTLLLVVDLALFFLIAQLYKRLVANLVAERARAAAQSEQLSFVALNLRTVQDKIGGVRVASTVRQDFVSVLDQLQALVDTNVELSDLKMNNSTLEFSARTSEVKSLNDFITRVVDGRKAPSLHGVVLSNLGLGRSGGFNFRLGAQYQSIWNN